MMCLTPDLSILAGNLTDHDWPLMASVSFIMDAVGGLATGQSPVVKYFDDPVVHHFDADGRILYLYDNDRHLEIKVWFCRSHNVDEFASLDYTLQ